MDDLIFRRQCMDLGIEPASRTIAPNTLFSEAWDTVLSPLYARLALRFFYHPRIALHDEDNLDIGVNLLKAIHERHLLILRNEARRLKKSEGLTIRTYVRCTFEAADLVTRKFFGTRLTPEDLKRLDWLRYAVTDPDAEIGPLIVEHEEQREPIPVRKAALVKA